MFKSPALQEADLLRGSKPLISTLVQTVKNLSCLPCILNLIRHDSQLFQCLLLFVRWRSHLPSKRRDITGQVFCLNRHLELQWIYKLLFSFFHLCQLFSQGFLTLCDYIFRGSLFRLFNINSYAGFSFQVLRHLLGYFFILTDQTCGVAQFMPLCMPKEIQQQQMIFSCFW